jgi:hypothetical protein
MERLVNMLARAGMRVQLTLTRADRRRQGGPHNNSILGLRSFLNRRDLGSAAGFSASRPT